MPDKLYSPENQMPHEIRTPLNAIMGFAELIYLEDDLSDQNSEYAKIIINSANELLCSMEKYVSFFSEGMENTGVNTASSWKEIEENRI